MRDNARRRIVFRFSKGRVNDVCLETKKYVMPKLKVAKSQKDATQRPADVLYKIEYRDPVSDGAEQAIAVMRKHDVPTFVYHPTLVRELVPGT